MSDTSQSTLALVEPDPLANVEALTVPQLAAFANAEMRNATGAALYHVCRAGCFLLAAKDRVPHGGWLSWLAANWEHSQQQANRYMEIAESCKRDPETVAQLEAKSLRGALAELGKPVEGGGARQKPRPGKAPASNHSRVSDSDKPPVTDADFTVTPMEDQAPGVSLEEAQKRAAAARAGQAPDLSKVVADTAAGRKAVEGAGQKKPAPAPPAPKSEPEGAAEKIAKLTQDYCDAVNALRPKRAVGDGVAIDGRCAAFASLISTTVSAFSADMTRKCRQYRVVEGPFIGREEPSSLEVSGAKGGKA